MATVTVDRTIDRPRPRHARAAPGDARHPHPGRGASARTHDNLARDVAYRHGANRLRPRRPPQQ